MTTQPEPASAPLKDAASEARNGAIRTALAAGKGMTHQGVGFIRDQLAARLLPRRLASFVSHRQAQQSEEVAGLPDKVDIDDLNAIKALVEKCGQDRIKQLVDLLG